MQLAGCGTFQSAEEQFLNQARERSDGTRRVLGNDMQPWL
jgi:hypothetical protein